MTRSREAAYYNCDDEAAWLLLLEEDEEVEEEEDDDVDDSDEDDAAGGWVKTLESFERGFFGGAGSDDGDEAPAPAEPGVGVGDEGGRAFIFVALAEACETGAETTFTPAIAWERDGCICMRAAGVMIREDRETVPKDGFGGEDFDNTGLPFSSLRVKIFFTSLASLAPDLFCSPAIFFSSTTGLFFSST